MNTPRKPNQTAILIQVATLTNHKKIVKHEQPKHATYWVMNPSINGQECIMSFLGLIKNSNIAKSEQSLIESTKQAFERHEAIAK
jgi:hypothetical protein